MNIKTSNRKQISEGIKWVKWIKAGKYLAMDSDRR